jgi:hypothetical protein
MTWLSVTEHLCDKWPRICFTLRSIPHSWLIAGFVTGVTRREQILERELPTLPEHMSSPPVFSGDRDTRSLMLCVMFCRLLFDLLTFFFWSLCCLSYFDIRILITPLVSATSSYEDCPRNAPCVTDQDIAFLVSEACWATVKNGNSMSVHLTEDTIKKTMRTTLVCALFRQFGSCFGDF